MVVTINRLSDKNTQRRAVFIGKCFYLRIIDSFVNIFINKRYGRNKR